jgi:hypothetical protein
MGATALVPRPPRRVRPAYAQVLFPSTLDLHIVHRAMNLSGPLTTANNLHIHLI